MGWKIPMQNSSPSPSCVHSYLGRSIYLTLPPSASKTLCTTSAAHSLGHVWIKAVKSLRSPCFAGATLQREENIIFNQDYSVEFTSVPEHVLSFTCVSYKKKIQTLNEITSTVTKIKSHLALVGASSRHMNLINSLYNDSNSDGACHDQWKGRSQVERCCSVHYHHGFCKFYYLINKNILSRWSQGMSEENESKENKDTIN